MIEEKDTTLIGFFDMLFNSMNPSSKSSITKDNLYDPLLPNGQL